MNPAEFRRVLGHFPTGVAAVTAVDPDTDAPLGMTIGSFVSVSLDPPLVAFLPSKTSSTFSRLRHAGTFCVNVLSTEQEWICRRFALSGPDKFEGVAWHPARDGAPVIDDVVAWIECRIDAIQDAGDHYIVIGEVLQCETADGDHPLIFFQGGYGRFTSPWLVMPPEPGLESLLRAVDTARSDMIELAYELNVECLAAANIGDDLVITASAGKPGRRLVESVGQRVPFIPPIGMALAAWSDPAEEAEWIRSVMAKPMLAHASILARKLDRVRDRGWAMALATPAQIALEAAVARLGRGTPTPGQRADVASAVRQMVSADGYEPADIDPQATYHVRHISAPVLGLDGRALFSLNLYGMPRDLTGVELGRYSRHLVERTQMISEKLGASTPALGAATP